MIDSVPALLTPGEFVVKKSAAQSIGYNSLNKMNQTGVQKFEAGGIVNTRRHAYGKSPKRKPGEAPIPAPAPDVGQTISAIKQLGGTTAEIIAIMKNYSEALNAGFSASETLASGLEDAGSSLQLVEIQALASAQALEDTIPLTKKGAPNKRDPKNKDVAALRGGIPVDEIAGKRQERDDAVKAKRLGDNDAKRAIGAQRAQKSLSSKAGLKQGKSDPKAEKRYREALKAYTKSIDRGRTQQEALESANKNLEVSTEKAAQETEKITKKQAQDTKKGPAKGPTKKQRDRTAAAERVQGVSQKATSAAFFSAAIITTAVQMSTL